MLRHRVPTIFTLYMIDVLCCALGCVILLWQVNHQEAESQTKTAEQRAKKNTDLLGKLELSNMTAGERAKEIADLLTKLNLSKQDAAALKDLIASLRSDLDASQKKGASLKEGLDLLRAALEASKKSEGKALLTIASLTGDLKT